MVRTAPKNALSLAALILVAGCLDATPTPAVAAAPPVLGAAPPAAASGDTCGIDGWVSDASLAGIPNVPVSIENTVYAALTDAEGRFSFSKLPAATYRITVSPAGYYKQAKSVECAPGEVVSDLVFSLAEVPNFDVPFSRAYYARGKIGCAVGLTPFQTEDLCKKGTTTPALVSDANNTLVFVPEVDLPMTRVVYELRWQKTSMTGAQFLTFPYKLPAEGTKLTPCPNSKAHTGYYVSGTSRSCLRLEPGEKRPYAYAPLSAKSSPWSLGVRPYGNVSVQQNPPGINDQSSKLVLDQAFEFVVTIGYNNASLAPDYTFFQ